MTSENFTSLIVNPAKIGESSLNELESLSVSFPYCQIIHSLIAKGVFEDANNNPNKETKISKAAAFSLSRNALRLILINQIEARFTHISTKTSSNLKVTLPTEAIKVHTSFELENKALPQRKKAKFDNLENFESLRKNDFSELLIKEETTLLENESKSHLINQWDLIDKFIEDQPRIRPIKTNRLQEESMILNNDLVGRSSPQSLDLVTESFAKIMAKTGNLKSSVETYEKLMLKNPEKRTYFATKIAEIKSKAINS